MTAPFFLVARYGLPSAGTEGAPVAAHVQARFAYTSAAHPNSVADHLLAHEVDEWIQAATEGGDLGGLDLLSGVAERGVGGGVRLDEESVGTGGDGGHGEGFDQVRASGGVAGIDDNGKV